MATPKSPTVVIQARDDLVSDAQEFLTRESLPKIEAFVDWLIEQNYLDDRYYELAEARRKPRVPVAVPPPVAAVPK